MTNKELQELLKPSPRRKIIQYKLIEGEEHFEDAVNEAIKNGWHVWGHPHIVHVLNCGTYCYQAMVKYDK